MDRARRTLILGVGAFAQGVMQLLKSDGAQPYAYLTRGYGHYAPSLEGPAFSEKHTANPCSLLKQHGIDLVIPMSLEWIHRSWREELLASNVPFLCPTGEALLLERDRDFARHLCLEAGIPFPRSYAAKDKAEAGAILERDPRPYVIKNPLCSPNSPIHTIVCETIEDTRAWLERIDYSEGVFLQEYVGRAEAGHIALVSDGEIYSIVTNQEYKRAHNGNMGIVAGAPLGGISEQDPNDKYGLAKELLAPLLPWFRKVSFHGPVQVTAALHQGRWHVLEYNVRLGVTNGPLLVGMLTNPFSILAGTAANKPIAPEFRPARKFGCSITLAGFGYPYVAIGGPPTLVKLAAPPDANIWWNEVARGNDGQLYATGHRLADVNAWGGTLEEATPMAYRNIALIQAHGSYYRTDIGQSLWPPGRV